MIKINGISKRHVQLLDEMWACDTFDEFDAMCRSKSAEDQIVIESLMKMILCECIDDNLGDMSEAKELLSKF